MVQKTKAVNNIAPLTNVTLTLGAVQATMDRDSSIPGITCLYGPSGWGKSKAAVFVRREYEAFYIEVKSVWSRKAILQNILRDMGIPFLDRETLPTLMERIAEELTLTGRPLIIDEADYLVDKGYASLIMDIYQSSHAAIMIIGEERLPMKLQQKHEKIHNRVLQWIAAQPASLEDCRKLAALLAPRVIIADDLLEHVRTVYDGCTRRIAVNIKHIKDAAETEGERKIDRSWWGERPLHTFTPAVRRV